MRPTTPRRMLCCCAVGCAMFALTELARSEAPEPSAAAADTTADQDLIERAAERFIAAYNDRDAAAIAALFGPNARMEDADGAVIEGRDAIEAAFAAAFEANPRAGLSLTMDSLRFITPDVAVEQGSTESFPDGETLTSRSRYIAVHAKQDGAWRIIASRTLEEEVLSNYERLRDLDWLLGEWIDEGADSTVEFTSTWDDNKSFLLNNFEVRQSGEVTMRGTQRIGWDPRTKQVRAWVFDSSGGFSESVWTNTGDEWVVKASGVSADGVPASATRTYRLLDRDHIIVRTTDRIAGAARLEDMDVTLTRKPPQPQAAAVP